MRDLHAVLRNRKGQPNQGAGAQGAAAPGSAAAARAPSPSSLQKGLDMAAGLTAGFGKSMLPAVLPVIDKLARWVGAGGREAPGAHSCVACAAWEVAKALGQRVRMALDPMQAGYVVADRLAAGKQAVQFAQRRT